MNKKYFAAIVCTTCIVCAPIASNACDKYPSGSIRKVLVENNNTIGSATLLRYGTAARGSIRWIAKERSLSIEEILDASIEIGKSSYPSVPLGQYKEKALRFMLSDEENPKMPVKDAAAITFLVEEARIQLMAEILGIAQFGDQSEDNLGIDKDGEPWQFQLLGGLKKEDYNQMIVELTYVRRIWQKQEKMTTETKILMEPYIQDSIVGLKHLKRSNSPKSEAKAIVEEFVIAGETTRHTDMLFGRSLNRGTWCP